MNGIDRQVGYWDRVADAKTFTHPFELERFAARVERPARILDQGCGYGRTLETLREAGYGNLVGLDISARMVERGRALHPGLDLRVQEGPGLPFPEAAFDAVLLFAVLTCIPTDAGQRTCIEEILRVLRPGGTLYASDYWLQEDARSVERYEGGRPAGAPYGVFRHAEGAVFRHHSRPWVEDLLGAFERPDLRDVDVVTMNGTRTRGFQFLGEKPPE